MFKRVISLFLIVSLALLGEGKVMAEEKFSADTNPNAIDVFLVSLREKESSNRYDLLHKPGVIPDSVTGKPVRVQALGAYGILDINWDVWSKQAGLEGAEWRDPKAQDAVAKYKVQQYYTEFNSWELVAIAWFSGPNKSRKLMNGKSINMDASDNMGTRISDYVAGMNNLMTENMMKIDIDMQPVTINEIPYSPQSPAISTPNSKFMTKDKYAANLLDAMSKANNPSGQRPDIFAQYAASKRDFSTQVPDESIDFVDSKIRTNIERGSL